MSIANCGSSPEPSALGALAGDGRAPFSDGFLGEAHSLEVSGLLERVTPGITGRFFGGVRATGELRICMRKLRS